MKIVGAIQKNLPRRLAGLRVEVVVETNQDFLLSSTEVAEELSMTRTISAAETVDVDETKSLVVAYL